MKFKLIAIVDNFKVYLYKVNIDNFLIKSVSYWKNNKWEKYIFLFSIYTDLNATAFLSAKSGKDFLRKETCYSIASLKTISCAM